MQVLHAIVPPSTRSHLRRQLLEVEETTNEVARPFIDTSDVTTVAVFIFTTISRDTKSTVDLSKSLSGLICRAIDGLRGISIGREAIQILDTRAKTEGTDQTKHGQATAEHLLICTHNLAMGIRA